MPSVDCPVPPGEPLPPVADLMAGCGLVPSKSAARRAIAEGGAYLNNVKVTEQDAVPAESDLLHGRYLILRRGKRTVGAIEVGQRCRGNRSGGDDEPVAGVVLGQPAGSRGGRPSGRMPGRRQPRHAVLYFLRREQAAR